MKRLFLFFAVAMPIIVSAQDDLVKKLDANKSDSAKKKFQFTDVIDLENTSVKNQGSSGTCWCYSSNSFIESEMIRMGKKPVDLSEIFIARKSYEDKAVNYLRMHGAVSWGDGGELHDVIQTYAKYGAVPQSVYTGLQYGATKNKFAEMQAILKGMLDALVANPNGTLSPGWKKAFSGVLDAYLGEAPKSFEWKGKKYMPKTFADEVVGINPDDYVEITSWKSSPYYKKTMLMVPDNWNFQEAYNVKMHDLTKIIDNALEKGYTVAWATDVSEKYFSWKNGVAYVPVKDFADMDEDEKKAIFDGPQEERKITSTMRQEAFDNYETTDDHGMHIVGMAKDQKGTEYYIVKNSWGDKNDHKGYLYVSKNYVLYKTTAILLHKKGIPSEISKALSI